MTNGSRGDERLNERMNAIDWNSLDRYYSGEASPQESAALERDPKLVESVREIWDAAGVVPTVGPTDVDEAWRTVAHRMDTIARPRVSRGIIPFPGTSNKRAWMPVVAMVAAVALAGVGLDRLMDAREAARLAASPPRERVFETSRAQRAEVNLRDGTRVMLNVDSRLRVSANYGAGARDVALEGEAYFDVVHDSTRPFRVHTPAGVAEDAGTSFLVAQYPEADGMRVAVKSGRVIVNRATTLEPRDVASVDAEGQVRVRHGVDVERDLAWTRGRLEFDRVPLAEVIPRLARWFDVEVMLADSSLAQVRYTAAFRNEPVEQVLELLAASLDARVTKGRGNGEQGVYTIHSAKRP